MGGLKLTFKLGPKKPAADAGEGGSGAYAPTRSLPTGPGDNAPHPFAAGARTGATGDAGAFGGDNGRPKIPMALLKAKLEREQAALAAASAAEAAARVSQGAGTMKGVPKALQKSQNSALGVASGKVEKKKVKRPIPAGALGVPGLPGAKIGGGSRPTGGGVGANSMDAGADAGYDSWGEDNDLPGPSFPSLVMKIKNGPLGMGAGGEARQQNTTPVPVPVFTEPPPKPSQLVDVLKKLQQKDPHQVFAEPVTEQIAPGYFAVVHSPMDMKTLKQNVSFGKYVTWDLFTTDVELVYRNAMAYNPLGTAVHALAAKSLALASKVLEKSQSSGLSPSSAAAKRVKIAHVASTASFGGAAGDAMELSMSTFGGVAVSMPSVSLGGTGTGADGDGSDANSDDDEEVGGPLGDENKKKKKTVRFWRHTFVENSQRAPYPSLAAWRDANCASSLFASAPSPATPQTMVRPSAVFFQKRKGSETYVEGLESWASALSGRAKVVATRLALAAKKLIPPPPPKPPTPPPPLEPSPTKENDRDDETTLALANETLREDGSESDDDAPLVSFATRGHPGGGGASGMAPMAHDVPPPVPVHNSARASALAREAASASARASACLQTAGLLSRGAAEVGSGGDPLIAVRATLGLGSSGTLGVSNGGVDSSNERTTDDSLVRVIRGIHQTWSAGLAKVREELRGAGVGKDAAVVPAPPPLPATRR